MQGAAVWKTAVLNLSLNRRCPLKKFLLFILYTIIIYSVSYPLFVLAVSWNDLQSYNGICPGTATDIPEYQCTHSEYVDRILFGGWAGLVHMMLFPFWMAGSAIAVFIIQYTVKRFRKRED